MRKFRVTALLLISVIAVAFLTVCVSGGQPEPDYDLVCDINDYGSFAGIFETAGETEWEAKGEYTVLLNGLHTPVTVKMDGMRVVSVSANGQTGELNIESYQGMVNAVIESVDGAVLVTEDTDYESTTWILTAEKCFEFRKEDGYSIRVYVCDDGTLGYQRIWDAYATTFNQEEYAPLYYCTSREHILTENGCVEISGEEYTLKKKSANTVSDEYDVDSMFEEAKRDEYAGEYFSAFSSVDEVFEANKNR